MLGRVEGITLETTFGGGVCLISSKPILHAVHANTIGWLGFQKKTNFSLFKMSNGMTGRIEMIQNDMLQQDQPKLSKTCHNNT